MRKDGKLVPVPMKEALDLVAAKMAETIKAHGKDAVAMYGSGQWTIPDGYVASKFMKGAIGTNNLEGNARLCMSSAVTGFMTSFGLDEPMGCYDDIDHADVFVLWGNNMAEMHPVLFSRLLDRRLKNPDVKIIDLATRWTRTSMAADRSILFTPADRPRLANAICHEIIRNGWVNRAFVRRARVLPRGQDQHRLRPRGQVRLQGRAEDHHVRALPRAPAGLRAREGRAALRRAGPRDPLPGLALRRPEAKGDERLVHGIQPAHARHLDQQPRLQHPPPGREDRDSGQQPLLADGPAERLRHGARSRHAHQPPARTATSPSEKSRKIAAEIWGVPVERIPPTPTYHTVEMFRALDRGDIRSSGSRSRTRWSRCRSSGATATAHKKDDRFVVVSDVYPTPTTDVADVVLPSAMWIEREGMFGNSERRTQHFEPMLTPPGEAMSDGWQMIEVARRMGFEKLFPWTRGHPHPGDLEGVHRFQRGPEHELAPYEELKPPAGRDVALRRTARKPSGATTRSTIRPPRPAQFDFYGKPDHRAWIWFRPYEPPPEVPDAAVSRSGSTPAASSSTGTRDR